MRRQAYIQLVVFQRCCSRSSSRLAVTWPAFAADMKTNPTRHSAAADTRGGTVEINSVSAEELDVLPAVGKAAKSPRELVDKKVAPHATYDRIKNRIVAHRGEARDDTAASRSRQGSEATSSGAGSSLVR